MGAEELTPRRRVRRDLGPNVGKLFISSTPSRVARRVRRPVLLALVSLLSLLGTGILPGLGARDVIAQRVAPGGRRRPPPAAPARRRPGGPGEQGPERAAVDDLPQRLHAGRRHRQPDRADQLRLPARRAHPGDREGRAGAPDQGRRPAGGPLPGHPRPGQRLLGSGADRPGGRPGLRHERLHLPLYTYENNPASTAARRRPAGPLHRQRRHGLRAPSWCWAR